MGNNDRVLAEIVSLLASIPSSFHDTQGLDWLGQAGFLFTQSDDPTLRARASTVIQNVTDPMRMKGMGAGKEFIILISQLKKELEFRCGYSIPRNYNLLSTSDTKRLQSETDSFKAAIIESNDLDSDNRETLLSEIAIFEATIAAPRVSTELMNRFVNAILMGAIVTLAGTAITKSANALIDTILNIISAGTV